MCRGAVAVKDRFDPIAPGGRKAAGFQAAMDISRFSVPTVSLSRLLRHALRKARELGLHGVELDVRSGLTPEEVSQSGIRQIRKWLADEGLVVACVAFPTRRGYADEEALEGRIAATKSAMKFAYEMGCDVVTNHVGDIPASEDAAKWKLLVDVLADLGHWGERVGARLAAEAGRAAPADLVRVFKAVPEGSIGCDLVTGSLVVHGHDPVEAVGLLGDHVLAVHATDAVAGAFAGRGRAVVLGTGQVDLPSVLAALGERDYRGWIGLEPVDGVGAEREIADAIRFLQSL